MAMNMLRDDVARAINRRPRVYRRRTAIDDYDDVDLLKRFRFDR